MPVIIEAPCFSHILPYISVDEDEWGWIVLTVHGNSNLDGDRDVTPILSKEDARRLGEYLIEVSELLEP